MPWIYPSIHRSLTFTYRETVEQCTNIASHTAKQRGNKQFLDLKRVKQRWSIKIIYDDFAFVYSKLQTHRFIANGAECWFLLFLWIWFVLVLLFAAYSFEQFYCFQFCSFSFVFPIYTHKQFEHRVPHITIMLWSWVLSGFHIIASNFTFTFIEYLCFTIPRTQHICIQYSIFCNQKILLGWKVKRKKIWRCRSKFETEVMTVKNMNIIRKVPQIWAALTNWVVCKSFTLFDTSPCAMVYKKAEHNEYFISIYYLCVLKTEHCVRIWFGQFTVCP